MTRQGLEVCAATLNSVKAAVEGGAVRIELCAALASDGVTPSMGMIKKAMEICGDAVDIHVLFRPREGNFVYSPEEIDSTCDDIAQFAAIAPPRAGIVIGALTPEGDIDVEACEKMIEAVKGIKNITFHRAFDRCREPLKALEDIISLGCNRLLTSGQAPSALQGVEMLDSLVKQSHGRISIMAAGGVSSANAATIVAQAKVKELHGSCRKNGGLDSDVQEIKAVKAVI